MFSMPLYEAKYDNEDAWQEISELKLMDELYRTYDKVTPAIKEMILGRELKTPHGIFRLKINGAEQTEAQSQYFPPKNDPQIPDPTT
jgi:hypothetical protein